jgi:Uma2 family endonuclease
VALHERSARLTYEDYVLFPDDGRRHEIIDGEHCVTPVPFLRHQAVVRQLTVALGSFLQDHPLGELFPAPVDVLLSRQDVVQPDLVYVARENRHILTERNVQGPPDLVIEILSPGTRKRDELVKLDLYERSGVRECWLLDPARGTVAVYTLADGRFRPPVEQSVERGDVLTTGLLPGFRVRLTSLFT